MTSNASPLATLSSCRRVRGIASCRGGCRRGKAPTPALRSRGGSRCFPPRRASSPASTSAQLRASPAAAKRPGAGRRIAGRQGDARRVPAPHRLRSGEADHQPHRRLPRRGARGSGDFGVDAARRSLRRDAPGRLRARRAAEDRRRSGRHQARPPDALVVEARSRRGRLLHRRTDVRARRAAAGARAWPSWRTQTNPGDSAATNLDLVHLVERAAGTHAHLGRRDGPRRDPPLRWPPQPGFGEAASINTLSAAIDFGKGLEAELIADVATAERRRSLATKVDGVAARRETQPAGADARPRALPGRASAPAPPIARSRCAPRWSEAAVDDLVGRVAAHGPAGQKPAPIPGFPRGGGSAADAPR